MKGAPTGVDALVASLYPALLAGDKYTIFRLLADDFHADVTPGFPLGAGGIHDGPQAMWNEVWAVIGRNYEMAIEPLEWIACVDGRLLVRGRYSGTARATGAAVDAPFAHLWTARDGRITSLWHVTDSARWAAALEPV
jgi:2-(1,2-epoxy-1,2-dihydrophenyl)acetyl-CoA isomerase